MFRFLTSGESHGPALTTIIDGLPSGLRLIPSMINHDLSRRQIGYGRGKRMEIEQDCVEFLSGIRFGKTLGTPLTLLIHNLDWPNWTTKMSPVPVTDNAQLPITQPRPGHADLAGLLKYNHSDIRNVLERASARETTTRVAVGAVCRALLSTFDIKIFSYVTEIGGIKIPFVSEDPIARFNASKNSELLCSCPEIEKKIKSRIDLCKSNGDSLGGIFEVIVTGLPVGLGTYAQWDMRLDGLLAQAFMSIQAIKGVEMGIGFNTARMKGSQVHDEIFYSTRKGYYRKTNRAGGIEGGISNGEHVIIRAAMKPIATLYSPLNTVDIKTKKQVKAAVERSDICRVPSAAVIGEAMAAIVLARLLLDKFGSDTMRDMAKNYKAYSNRIKSI